MQVQEADLHRVAVATGAQVQTTVNNLNPRVLGTCENFEEKQARPASHVHDAHCILAVPRRSMRSTTRSRYVIVFVTYLTST